MCQGTCALPWEIINQISTPVPQRHGYWPLELMLQEATCTHLALEGSQTKSCKNSRWQNLEITKAMTLPLASTHSLGDSCTFATRHTNTHTPPLSCGDIWRTGAWRENRFWEVRWGGGAGWLRVWGKQHLWVQRACLMCSLALTAPLGKTADDKLSGEVSYSCTISLPRSLALSVSFTLSSCPCRVRTAFGAVSLALSSLPDTIQPLSSWLSYHKLNHLNVEKNKTQA